MNVMFDLNVLLDVIQKREPHFAASAEVCARAVRKEFTAFVPAHAVTTLAYVVRRHVGPKKEAEVLDWLLANFKVASTGHPDLLRARAYGWTDFEDAVVAALAEGNGCRLILSRNIRDFKGSTVPAMTPEEFLAGIAPDGATTNGRR
jgi:predicted nucleic acid-binding protein